ncbi:MAG: hypothetical protein RLZZ458_2184 [Planctomycetota bacterium]|jgi:hypothetical protein
MRTLRGVVLLLTVAMAVLCGVAARRCHAQDTSTKAQVRVVDVIWGFDGRVSAGHFQPLSLLLDNLSGEVIEGRVLIRLNAGGSGEQRGAIHEQPIYVGARSRRWVQFYPYIPEVPELWDVYLETEAGRLDLQSLDPPRLAADASRARLMGSGSAGKAGSTEPEALPAVFLVPERNQDRFPTSVKHMPAEIFPPYSTATGGLFAIYLDHVPDWEEPRQQAFLSWLRGGGRLHLLLDSNRRELQFSGILSVLNEPMPEFRLSSGRVKREDVQRHELSEDRVRAVVQPARSEREPAVEQQQAFQVSGIGSEWWDLLNDEDLFARLRQVVEPQHAWPIIALLSLLYVGALYPGIWRYSSQTNHRPLQTIGAVLLLSGVFSLMFLWLGRRGYGETQSVLTYMVAAAEDEEHWDCLQFSQLFATDGGSFELKSEGQQALLAAGTRLERSEGLIQAGNSAYLRTRLAPYSTESMTVRRRLRLPDWKAGVAIREVAGGSLSRLQLRLGPDFPFADNPVCLAMVGKNIYTLSLNRAAGTAVMTGTGTALENWLAQHSGVDLSVFSWQTQSADEEAATEEQKLRSMLLRRGFGVKNLLVGDVRIDDDSVLLVVQTKLPESFRLGWSPDVPEDGQVLFMKLLPVDLSDPG